jgi:type VI secretion system protein VasD
MKRNNWLTMMSGILLLGGVVACSSVNTKVGGMMGLDSDLNITFKTDADINPDEKNQPSPLFIRLYELKSTKQFEKANFLDIFERDSEVLGTDLVAKQTLKRLKPGEARKDHLVLKPETRYVGLVAEFLQYKSARFKVVFPIDPTNVIASSAEISISGNKLSSNRNIEK